ncbi:related to DNA-directed DNA polymerase [Phialocephala subalpina]|uniref:polynucleotide adenylyltransferase n=1 Tax=Phialocephala subalpina TaxID=576137 RepID=A0A1L7X8C4_9HELO|nr:related to DNA-directed DNA polymerase [Phialocephala subalpina]
MSSRQPPLPPGPPPPRAYNDSYDRNRGGDSYYPDSRDSRYSPAPPPPGGPDMYRFAGSSDKYQPSYARPRSPPRYGAYASSQDDRSYRPSYAPPPPREQTSTYRPSYDEGFNFRYDAPPGIDYRAADQYRAPPREPARQNNANRNNDRGFSRGQRGGRGSARGRGGPRMASERDFLKTNREPTPELMPGMDEDAGNGVRYKAVDDLSDSDEAEMDLSNSDEENDENDAEQPKKKQTRTETKAADGDSVPRWSNPDPYTALPPPDESQRKKKDVVKLIRKARVDAAQDGAKTEAAAADFISFDFDDDEVDGKQGQQFGLGVEGAPTGPRSGKNDTLPHPGKENYVPGTTLNSQERSFNPINISTSNIKVNTGDIGDEMRAPNGLPTRQNDWPSSASSSKAAMQFTLPAAQPANHVKPAPISLESDPNLGSRKRNFDDQIKGPPRIHGPALGKGAKAANGEIVRHWQPVPGQSPTPWISMDHSDSASMGVWLHKEIMDFYHYVKPRDFEQFLRVKLVENLRSKLKTHFARDADVLAFGSFPAGLYLPTADMDLVCVSDSFMDGGRAVLGNRKALVNFRNFVSHQRLALDDQIECIYGAKVPLVKYVDKLTGLKVDVSFENETGLIANKTFQDWKTIFPAMPIIVSLIKHLLAMRGLNEPVNGGIGGFSVICLVVSLLQNMPQVQSKSMIPEHNLGEILMEFFDLYGNQFNIETTAISLNPPGYISKAHANVPYKKNNPYKFMIIDPNRSSNDISGGASNSGAIVNLFSECYGNLQARLSHLQYSPERRCQSILGSIIGGNYSSFRLQREHLAHVHEHLYGSVDPAAV